MSKPSFPRSRRVNAIIQEVLAEEVKRLTDPRIGLVSITGVEVAPDMRRAIVFVSALDQSHPGETIKGLRRLPHAFELRSAGKYTSNTRRSSSSGQMPESCGASESTRSCTNSNTKRTDTLPMPMTERFPDLEEGR